MQQTKTSDATRDEVRYGVFLRPDAALIDEAVRGMLILKHQFGLKAGLAYPPHITLVGSIALDPGEPVRFDQGQRPELFEREKALIAAFDDVLATHPVQRLDRYKFNCSENGYISWRFRDREGNDLTGLMGDLLNAARPLRVYHDTDRFVEKRKKDDPSNFMAHLTLLGHDGREHPLVVKEAYEVFKQLGYSTPRALDADTVTLYRFASKDWSGDYWDNFQFRILKSWTLG